MNECFKELPVTFIFNYENKIGFMNSNKIITNSGEQVDCNTKSEIVVFQEHEGKSINEWKQKE